MRRDGPPNPYESPSVPSVAQSRHGIRPALVTSSLSFVGLFLIGPYGQVIPPVGAALMLLAVPAAFFAIKEWSTKPKWQSRLSLVLAVLVMMNYVTVFGLYLFLKSSG